MAEVKEIHSEPQVQLTMSMDEAELLAAILHHTTLNEPEVSSLWLALQPYNTNSFTVSQNNGSICVSRLEE